jgi:hypothetical protein
MNKISLADRIDSIRVWISLGIIVVVVAAVVFLRARHPGTAYPGAEECRTAYRKANTSTDSAVVDVLHPATGAPKDPNAPTCKTLRLTGELR